MSEPAVNESAETALRAGVGAGRTSTPGAASPGETPPMSEWPGVCVLVQASGLPLRPTEVNLELGFWMYSLFHNLDGPLRTAPKFEKHHLSARPWMAARS